MWPQKPLLVTGKWFSHEEKGGKWLFLKIRSAPDFELLDSECPYYNLPISKKIHRDTFFFSQSMLLPLVLYHAFNYIQLVYSKSISHKKPVPPCSDPVPPSTNHYRPILIQYHQPLPPETDPAPPSTNQHSFFQIQLSHFPSLSSLDERSCTSV